MAKDLISIQDDTKLELVKQTEKLEKVEDNVVAVEKDVVEADKEIDKA
jgi:t-SNARE complex subunit (syntaxin)